MIPAAGQERSLMIAARIRRERLNEGEIPRARAALSLAAMMDAFGMDGLMYRYIIAWREESEGERKVCVPLRIIGALTIERRAMGELSW